MSARCEALYCNETVLFGVNVMFDDITFWSAVTGLEWAFGATAIVEGFCFIMLVGLPIVWVGQMLYALRAGSSSSSGE